MQQEQLSPETEAKLSTVGRKYFKLIEFDEEEVLLKEIRKHPIGRVFIYLTGGFVALIMAILFGIFAFGDTSTSLFAGTGIDAGSASGVIAFIGLIIIIFAVVVMVIQDILYTNNVIFLTNEKLAQVLYINIFNRKISQLSIGDVQDVTVTQKGILAHMFNYGTLVIETAGEQQNYTFTYVPDPYITSKAIVGAHEQNLKAFGN